MNPDVIHKYFPCGSDVYHEHLLSLLNQLASIDNLFYTIVTLENGEYKLGYISPSVEQLTGYPLQQFSYDQGFSFIDSIKPVAFQKSIAHQEDIYVEKAKNMDQHLTEPFIVELDATLERKGTERITAHLVGIVLQVTPKRIPCLAINAWCITHQLLQHQYVENIYQTQSLLRNIHTIYSIIFDLKLSCLNVEKTMAFNCALYNFELPTKQEHRVLTLLADGLSTKFIAERLNISYHTADSHRRHLLHKFRAVNIAQMIKKATKLYWLE